MTAPDDSSSKDVGNEKNNKNVPIRLPEGLHGFRERFIDRGNVPLTRWLDCRAYAHGLSTSGTAETS
jgi:hypothetical protein